MAINIGTINLNGAKIEGENPFPIFRDPNYHVDVNYDDTIEKSVADKFGYMSGFRVLPYKMQNKYNRNKQKIELKTIVMENDYLKVTFLPDYGGRIYSMFNKKLNRELLSTNPVFQPANLALRNAWFSGGIEWNIGHFGHTYLTCEPVFFAICHNEDNEQFLRMYEYERCKNIYYQIDFYLPDDATQLYTYTKIINNRNEAVPVYYWSNTAVSELNKARVFSTTDEVIFMKPNEMSEMSAVENQSFSQGKLPNLEGIEGDASYPRTFYRSNEYFYQTPTDITYPWEAVTYDDGFIFYECSSKQLPFRKMFCWGTHKGGQKWQEYLSKKDGDQYVEIQAGLFPTQLHSDDMPGNSVIEFFQVFGGTQKEDIDKFYDEWHKSKEYVEKIVFEEINQDKLQEIEHILTNSALVCPDKILHYGSGWGALESLRKKHNQEEMNIKSMVFPADSMDSLQEYWRNILIDHKSDIKYEDIIPISYMVDTKWLDIINESIEKYGNDNYLSYLHQGIMYHEVGEVEKALNSLKKSIEMNETIVGFRSIGSIMSKLDRIDEALHYYDNAFLLQSDSVSIDFMVEYLQLLIDAKKYLVAWKLYEKYELDLKDEEILSVIIKAAYELDKREFIENVFDIEPARIREGDNTLVDIWFKYQAKLEAEETGIEVTDVLLREIKKKLLPPNNIDFRMFE